MHGENCLVQMFTKGIDGGHRFFKCPRARVIAIIFRLLNMFLEYPYNSQDILIVVFRVRKNCGFTRWVDPRPIYPHQQYIYYLQDQIFNLQREVSSGYKEDEYDDNNNGASSQEALCNDLSPPPPPTTTMGGYYGEGATQFAMCHTTRTTLSYSHGTSMCLLFGLIT